MIVRCGSNDLVPPSVQSAALQHADSVFRLSLGCVVGSPLSDTDRRIASLGLAAGEVGACSALSPVPRLMSPIWTVARNPGAGAWFIALLHLPSSWSAFVDVSGCQCGNPTQHFHFAVKPWAAGHLRRSQGLSPQRFEAVVFSVARDQCAGAPVREKPGLLPSRPPDYDPGIVISAAPLTCSPHQQRSPPLALLGSSRQWSRARPNFTVCLCWALHPSLRS